MKTLTRCKIKTSLFLTLLATSAYSGLSLAQDTDPATPVTRMSYHDNAVKLVIQSSGYTLLGGSYETMNQRISSGQDPDGKNSPPQRYDVTGHEGRISFEVGRKGSEQVAEWFAKRVGGNLNTFGKNPDRLNFAFQGDLSLSIEGPGLDPDKPVVLPNIFLAQGHSGSTNNWWFGGQTCMKVIEFDSNKVQCTSTSYPSMTFTFIRGDINASKRTPIDEVYVYIKQ
ncbi:MAG TPA: hypothetical protein VIM98_14475 [Dyella sp.]|uniref:hypothetical protein n=1 Tax=Dyella sp. TaxID=1869338 RepID=UPI002F94C3D4